MSGTVAEILAAKTTNVWSVEPDASVFDAIALMADKDIGALVVFEADKLAGIVSERDYARKVILSGRSSRDTRVEDIMTAHPATVTPEHSVEQCMRIMTEDRVRHLPVLDRGRVTGIVSIGDLVKAIISAQAQTIDQLSHYIAGRYPA